MRSRIFQGLPPHGARQAIGLFGGTFNPPHSGHRRASLLALKRLGLDHIWWIVTPGNPLKANDGLPPLKSRMHAAAAVAAHPRISVTGVEVELASRYTADLIGALKERAPSLRFVWIMGSDNLGQFHRWDRWRTIADAVPIAVVNRPGYLNAALSAPAAQALARCRLDEADGRILAARRLPAWTFITGPRSLASSTALRAGTGRS